MKNRSNRGHRMLDVLRQAQEFGDAVERGRSSSFSRDGMSRYDQLRRASYRR